jgi:IMP dehydrogenase
MILSGARDRLKDLKAGYTYDQLIIRPGKSDVPSRSSVDLTSTLLPDVELKIPIIAAPMPTVCGEKMCINMYNAGALGILHRWSSTEELVKIMRRIRKGGVPKQCAAFAIGINKDDKKLLKAMAKIAGIVCIDVNIGHYTRVIQMIRYIKKNYPRLKIIAGNVSTFEGAADLAAAGADCIRATNGGGSACWTLKVTGVGVPTATSLAECIDGARDIAVSQDRKITVIADGGHVNSGSMTKAITLGADAVMIGGLLSGSSWCPPEGFAVINGELKGRYFGMASEEAQQLRQGGVKPGTAPEGESKIIPVKEKGKMIIDRLAGGIRSGLSLVGARNLNELRHKAIFMRM